MRGVVAATGRIVEHTLAAASAEEAKERAEASGLEFVVVQPAEAPRPPPSPDPNPPGPGGAPPLPGSAGSMLPE